MKNRTRKIFVAVTMIALLAMMCATLVACNGDDAQGLTQGVKVVYHFNDGTDGAHVEEGLAVNEIATKYAPPAREGYTFKGWTLDENGAEPFRASSFKGGAELDLYASWSLKTFNVVFRIEESDSEIARVVEYGRAAKLPDDSEIDGLIPANFTLEGWLDENDELMDEDDANASYKHITADMTYYAKLVPNNYTVKFFLTEDGEAFDTKVGALGAEISPSDDPIKAPPAKEGFSFEGWFNESNENFRDNPTFTKNENYYAKYALVKPNMPMLDSEEETFIVTYGEELSLAMLRVSQASGVNYTYEWRKDGENAETGLAFDVPVQTLGAGTHTYSIRVTASCIGYTSVSSEEMEFTVEIARAVITCEIAPLELTYGDPLPSLSDGIITFSGFKYEDTEDVVDATAAKLKSDNYTPGAAVGDEYSYYIDGYAADNYDFVGKDGGTLSSSLTVRQKAATVTLTNALTTTYGSDQTRFEPAESRYTTEGLLADHTAKLALTLKKFIPADYSIGEDLLAEVTVSNKQGEDVSANYSFAVTATVKVEEGTIIYKEPDESARTFTYDAMEHTIGIEELPDETLATYKRSQNEEYAAQTPTFTNAGEYTVYFKLEREYYRTVESSFMVKVNKAKVEVTAMEQETTYGAEFELDKEKYRIMNDIPGNNAFQFYAQCEDYEPGDDIGKYTITIWHEINDNIEFEVTTNILTVKPAPITITPADITLRYGDPLPETGLFTISGLPEKAKAQPQITASTTYLPGTKAGSVCDITLAEVEGENGNYVITIGSEDGKAAGSVTVEKRDIALTLGNFSVMYGEDVQASSFAFEISDGEMYNGEQLKLNFYTDYSIGDAAEGTHIISARTTSDEVNSNYNVSITNGELTVTKRPVSLIVNDATVTYGEELDSRAYGYKLAEGSLDFFGAAPAPNYTNTYAAGATSGTIEATFDDQNHEINVQNGTINIAKRNISITLKGVHANNGQPYSHVFQPNDSAVNNLFAHDVLSGTLETSSSDDATYDGIGMFKWSAALEIKNEKDDDVLNFYDINYILNIQISHELIQIDIKDWSGEYDGGEHTGSATIKEDQDLTNAKITYSREREGEYSENIPKFTAANTYTFFAKATADNKTETIAEITVNISKRRATLTATSTRVTFGDAAPSLGFTQSRVLEDDMASLNISATSDYKQNDDVKAGGYEIYVTFTPNDNYEITVVKGTLTVDPKAVVVTLPNGANVTYGEKFAYSGEYTFSEEIARGDKLTFDSKYREGYDGVNDEGYDITATGSPNFKYTVETKLMVTPRKATIALAQTTTTYGADPTTALRKNTSFTNLYGTDSVEVTYSGYGKDANLEGYAVTPSVTPNAISKNYDFDITGNKLIVNKASLKLTLKGSLSIIYGDPLPSYEVGSASGLVGGDTDWTQVVSGEFAASSLYPESKRDVGSYIVTGGGYTSANYSISYNKFFLTVGQATLTFTVNDVSDICYGDAFPAQLGFEVSGFKYDDNAQSLELPALLDVTTSYKAGVTTANTPCTYSVSVAELNFANYRVVSTSKRFTLLKATYKNITHAEITNKTYSPTLKLSEIDLNTGAYKDFKWKDGSAHPTCDVTTYAAIYNADTKNYNDFELNITLKLAKATPTFTAEKPAPEFDWTGTAINLQTVLGKVTSDNPETSTVTFDASNPTTGTDGGIYKLKYTTPETTNFKAGSYTFEVKIKAADLNGTLYTIEDALTHATSGDEIWLKHNIFLSKNVTLKAGVTINMPYDGTNLTGDGVVGASGNNAQSYNIDVLNNTEFQRVLLTIRTGVTLTLLGTIKVGGITGINNGAYFQGATCSYYARIHLEGTAEISANSGSVLDLHGFITSSDNKAKFTMNSGSTLKAPFVVHDYRGGSCTGGEYNTGKISPFNQYEMPNIQNITQTIYSGAKVIAYVSLRTEDVNIVVTLPASYNKAETTIISTSNAMINLTKGSFTVVHKPSIGSATDNKTSITLNANSVAEIGSLSMTVDTGIATINVNTSTVYFPIPYNYDITISNNATLTVPNKVKMLPGAKITVNSGGILDLTGGGLIVYDGNWNDNWNGATEGTRVYPKGKGAAQIIVKGTFNISAAFGGAITGSSGGKVVVNTNTLSIAAKEGYGTRDFLTFKFEQTYSQTYTASLNGYSGSLANGSTYTCNGTTWTKS